MIGREAGAARAGRTATSLESLDCSAELARVHPQGFAWAVRCCRGDREEAEDVLQLAYAKVLDGRARFEQRSSFKTWLFGVIRRTAQEQARREWLRRNRLVRWWRDRVFDPGSARDQAEELARADEIANLKSALTRLSARQAEVLHLVFYQDLSIQEAADVLQLPVGTARTHYERGKARLRRLLTDRRSDS